MDNISVLSQLFDIYQTQEWWHKKKLGKEDFFRYTDKLLRSGNIFFVVDGVSPTPDGTPRVVGYTEVWKIDYAQFGRLICGEDIKASEEDTQTGKLAYVANVWIDEAYRVGFGEFIKVSVVKTMRRMYYEFTADVEYHCGQALRKTQSQPVKVFKAKLLKGEKYGRT
jgi:hypothetical protein